MSNTVYFIAQYYANIHGTSYLMLIGYSFDNYYIEYSNLKNIVIP